MVSESNETEKKTPREESQQALVVSATAILDLSMTYILNIGPGLASRPIVPSEMMLVGPLLTMWF